MHAQIIYTYSYAYEEHNWYNAHAFFPVWGFRNDSSEQSQIFLHVYKCKALT